MPKKPTMAATSRSLRLCLSALAILTLAACGSITDAMGVRDPFGMQRPFEGTNRDWAALTSIIGEEAVFVAPVAGLEGSLGADLAARIADALQQRDILATSRNAPEDSLTLQGSMEGQTLRLSLTEISGRVRAEFAVALPPSAQAGAMDGMTLTALAEETATRITETMGKAQSAPPANDVAAINAPRVRVSAITGGPDEAGPLLARAAAMGLSRRGVVIAENDAPFDFELSASITVTGDAPESRLVTINWTLADSAGVPLGDVTQANEMPIRAINGPWGETAALAGDAAAEGITALLAELLRRR